MDALKSTYRRNVNDSIRLLEGREHRDQLIHTYVRDLPIWKTATSIAVTMSLPLEVDTIRLIEWAWREGKQVLVPKVKQQTMTFHAIRSFEEVAPGVRGILEPTTNPEETIPDLCIVPGRVFDEHGYRIGWGGGYYDRFLPEYAGETIALAYSLQVYAQIPIEEHDVPVNFIVTEEGVIPCHSLRSPQ